MAPKGASAEPKSDVESPTPSPEPEEDVPRRKKSKAKRVRVVKSDVMHRRSREGCYTCRVRRKKCDEITPTCTSCRNLQLRCEYDLPTWWKTPEMRKHHKNTIKQSIRTTKPPGNSKSSRANPMPPPPPSVDSPPSLSHSIATPCSSVEPCPPPDRSSFDQSSFSPPQTFSPPLRTDTPQSMFDSTPSMPQVQWTPIPPQYPAFPTPPASNSNWASNPNWEMDIKTERQTYVNGMASAIDSTTSTFGTWEPPTPTMMLPSYPPWTKQETFDVHAEGFSEDHFDPNFFQFGHEPVSAEADIILKVDDCDQPLLAHFIENVAPPLFSVFDAKQKGSSLRDIILPQLANNPIFLHCCLSTAAQHLKITEHILGEDINTDIIRHRQTAIASLCEALQNETVDPSRLLEATLAMIVFQSAVGSADDELPDIPWHAHFEAVADLTNKVLELTPYNHYNYGGHQAAFNMTLAYWIDILGATTMRRVPTFADTYRDRIESGLQSGLRELMGCEDHIMYLISEIVCLDTLKHTSDMDQDTLCQHIENLGVRLSYTELGPGELAHISTPDTQAIRPRQLTQNITAIFRLAARIYLCSLLPEFNAEVASIVELVNKVTDALSYMPKGPNGFDRALVWPLLVAGSVAGPSSSFRTVFKDRVSQLGEASQLGSFNTVQQLLDEVWHINDENDTQGMPDRVTWRDVMEGKGLSSLII